jgi:hypothetical protein
VLILLSPRSLVLAICSHSYLWLWRCAAGANNKYKCFSAIYIDYRRK